jgi:hypothetical protein
VIFIKLNSSVITFRLWHCSVDALEGGVDACANTMTQLLDVLNERRLLPAAEEHSIANLDNALEASPGVYSLPSALKIR